MTMNSQYVYFEYYIGGNDRVVCGVTWYMAFDRIHRDSVRVILCWIVLSVDG